MIMDLTTLKKLKIENRKTFEKLVGWGWVDSLSGRDLDWTFWCGRKSPQIFRDDKPIYDKRELPKRRFARNVGSWSGQPQNLYGKRTN
jgi:hypothetical protein